MIPIDLIFFWAAFISLAIFFTWYLYRWGKSRFGLFDWLTLRARIKELRRREKKAAREKRQRMKARARAEKKRASPWRNVTVKSRIYYVYSLIAFSFLAMRPGFKFIDYRDLAIVMASIAAGIILFEAIRDTRATVTTVSATLEKMPPEQQRRALRLIRSIQREEDPRQLAPPDRADIQ